jgi:hypothetical protein
MPDNVTCQEETATILAKIMWTLRCKLTVLLCLCDVTLSVYPHRAGLKNMPGLTVGFEPTWPGIFFKPARCGYTLRVTSHKHLNHLSTLYQHSKYHNCITVGIHFLVSLSPPPPLPPTMLVLTFILQSFHLTNV